MTTMLPAARVSIRCALFGHKVHHTRIASDACTPCARCGVAILAQGNISHVGHTLSCLFGKHHYVTTSTRAAHNEYLCEKCGHSQLFELARDPHSSHRQFKKRVSYACTILGHRVHVVSTGSKATDYACQCGHPFIKVQRALTVIRHPLACVLRGHFVTVNETRSDWVEYVCRRCGHTFYFRLAALGQLKSDRHK